MIIIAVNEIVSYLLIGCVFYFDECQSKKHNLILSLISSIMIEMYIYNLRVDSLKSFIYTIILSLFFTATYTDFREKKVINANILFMYISVLLLIVIDIIIKNNNINNIKALVITLLIELILVKINAMGEGDIPILLIISYMFKYESLIIITMSLIISLVVGLLLMILRREKTKWIPLVPGFFIALLIYLSYNFPYQIFL